MNHSKTALSACLVGVLLPAIAFGARHGSVTPVPGSPSLLVMPPKPVETRGMQKPGLINPSDKKQDLVYLLFPHDGAVFPASNMITFGWMPPTEEILGNKRPALYEIAVTTAGHNITRKKVPPRGNEAVTTTIFGQLAPGYYQWQVSGTLPSGELFGSEVRVFQVLP